MTFSGRHLSAKIKGLPRISRSETCFLYVSVQEQRRIEDEKLKTSINKSTSILFYFNKVKAILPK